MVVWSSKSFYTVGDTNKTPRDDGTSGTMIYGALIAEDGWSIALPIPWRQDVGGFLLGEAMSFLYVPILMILALAVMSAVDVIFHRKASRKKWRARGGVAVLLTVLVILLKLSGW